MNPIFGGFGIISPFLPSDLHAKPACLGGKAIMLLFAAIWVVPGLNSALWSVVFGGAQLPGVDSHMTVSSLSAFQFWC